MDCYKWLLVPPPKESLDGIETKYGDEYLNELVTGYHENQAAAKVHFAERKKSIMAEGLDKHLLPSERLPPPPDARPPPTTDGAEAETEAEASGSGRDSTATDADAEAAEAAAEVIAGTSN